jgi:hypothetical protein
LAIVVNRCASRTSISVMAEKGREGCFQEQACLSYSFPATITNSPATGEFKREAVDWLANCTRFVSCGCRLKERPGKCRAKTRGTPPAVTGSGRFLTTHRAAAGRP